MKKKPEPKKKPSSAAIKASCRQMNHGNPEIYHPNAKDRQRVLESHYGVKT